MSLDDSIPNNYPSSCESAQGREFQVSINSLFPGQKLKSQAEGETRWGRHTGAWRIETHTLESLCRRVTEDGFAFCAVLKRPWRDASNFQSIQVLATDNDGASLEILSQIPLVADHAAFIYESPSSTVEHPKARAVFVLDSPITDPQICRLAYRALIWYFSNGAPDEAADRACKDCCRFFYGRPHAPHVFLGNVLYQDVLQEIIEGYLRSGTGGDLSAPSAHTRTGEYNRTGDYDPHRGPQLTPADQASLAKFLLPQGMHTAADGRFNGACLFHDCDCPGAFYVSGRSGSWYCFCSDHPGQNHGSVADLEGLGFTPANAREVETDQNVPNTVHPYHHIQNISPPPDFKPRKRGNIKPSPLWDYCRGQFPAPVGVKPKLKSAVLLNRKELRKIIGNLYSNTWFNRANEMFKKATMLMHLVKTFAKADAHYRLVPADDWTENRHKALKTRIERAGGRYYAIDNQVSRGFWVYLSTVPVKGFKPITDLVPFLTDAVKGIRVPREVPTDGRFRPTRSSQVLTKAIDEAPADEDAGKYELVAMKRGPTDFAAVEADLRESGTPYEYVDPVYRAMPDQCIIAGVDPVDPYGHTLAFGVAHEYTPCRRAKSRQEAASGQTR